MKAPPDQCLKLLSKPQHPESSFHTGPSRRAGARWGRSVGPGYVWECPGVPRQSPERIPHWPQESLLISG
jgi:hypothetical protein